MVPMVFWNHPAVVARALSVGLFLNPAGNAGIGAYRIADHPARAAAAGCSRRDPVRLDVDHAAGTHARRCAAGDLGGGAAIAVLVVLCALVALIPTLSRSVRAVPRPEVWQAELAAATPIVHDDLAAKVPA